MHISRVVHSGGTTDSSFGIALRILPRLLKFVWNAYWGWTVVQWILHLGLGLLPIVVVSLSRWTIDEVAKLTGPDGNLSLVVWLLAANFMIVLISQGIKLMVGMLETKLQESADVEVQGEVLTKITRLPVSFFEDSDSYDLIQQASGGLGRRMIQASMTAARLCGSATALLSYLWLISTIHWGLVIAVSVLFCLSFWVNSRWGQQRYWLGMAQTEAQRKQSYLESLLVGPHAAKELRLFGAGGYWLEQWRLAADRVREDRIRLGFRQSTEQVGLQTVSDLLSFVTGLFLVTLISGTKLTVGGYVALGGAIASSLGEIRNLTVTLAYIVEQSLFTRDFFRLLDLPEENGGGELAFPSPLTQGINVSGLSFSYPGSGRHAIQDITCQIRAGELVAIVGENGSGKTTLVKCLLGLYSPSAGVITFDGIPVQSLDQRSLRSSFGVIFQDFVRYALPARENVGVGNLQHLYDDEALSLAVRISGGSEILDRLPHGWETPLSKMWRGGVDLSGGEWQRLAVARAFLRNAQVVVLDEPTAAVDPRAEAAFFEQLAAVTRGKTGVFISHRIGMARHADRIFVMKAGKLIETGTHDELMNANGEYARLFLLQAQWYQ